MREIEGYLETLESECEYILWRIKNVNNKDMLFKYRVREQELSLKMMKLRKWLDKQGEVNGQ
jgi:hypothetical protein